MNIVEEAELFARAAHGAIGQTRAFTDGFIPYIIHPERVASLVSEAQGSPQMRAAAWLHDVVEDTHITLGQIEQHFGSMIVGYIEGLTENKESYPTKAARKKAVADGMKTASLEIRTIKVADIVANMEDLVMYYDKIMKEAPEFPDRYLNQQRYLFASICKDVHPLLYARAHELLYGRFYDKELPTHTQSAGMP
jgi:(p)ppGpp synthase/HD superfamily hydrolase